MLALKLIQKISTLFCLAYILNVEIVGQTYNWEDCNLYIPDDTMQIVIADFLKTGDRFCSVGVHGISDRGFYILNADSCWLRQNSELNNIYIYDVQPSASDCLFLIDNQSLYRSCDSARSWQRICEYGCSMLSVKDSLIVIGDMYNSQFYYSADLGVNWHTKSTPIRFRGFAAGIDNYVYVDDYENGIFRAKIDDDQWHWVGPAGWWNRPIRVLDDGRVLAYEEIKEDLYLSNPDGENYQLILSKDIYDIFIEGGVNVWVMTQDGIFYRTQAENQWIQISAEDLGYTGRLFVDQNGAIWTYEPDGGVSMSPDSGKHWSSINSGLTYLVPVETDVVKIAFDDTDRVYVNVKGKGIFYSDNTRNSWDLIKPGRYWGPECGASGALYLACPDSILISLDRGATWYAKSSIYDIGLYLTMNSKEYLYTTSRPYQCTGQWCGGYLVRYKPLEDEFAYLGYFGSGFYVPRTYCLPGDLLLLQRNTPIYRSENDGDSWENIGSLPGNQSGLFWGNSKGIIFAGTEDGVFKSSDSAATWIEANDGLTDLHVTAAVLDSEEQIFLGTENGLFFSDNEGAIWSEISDGLLNTSITDIAVNRTGIVYVGTTNGIFKSNCSTAIHTVSLVIPEKVRLSQNFPNPFNGTTHIQFELPFRTEVSLKIFNLNGKWIRTLCSEFYPAGSHSVNWDGTDEAAHPVPSGVYIYQLVTDERRITEKMLYVK